MPVRAPDTWPGSYFQWPISTSRMRPLAAIKLVFCNATSSAANRSLDIVPPLSARSVAIFSIAC